MDRAYIMHGEKIYEYSILIGKLEDFEVDRKIILKWILEK
jgi:hypothetical protein